MIDKNKVYGVCGATGRILGTRYAGSILIALRKKFPQGFRSGEAERFLVKKRIFPASASGEIGERGACNIYERLLQWTRAELLERSGSPPFLSYTFPDGINYRPDARRNTDTSVVVAEVPSNLSKLLDEFADEQGKSVDAVVAKALSMYLPSVRHNEKRT